MESNERVTLPSGDWWEVKGPEDFTHADRRWVDRQVTKDALSLMRDFEGIDLEAFRDKTEAKKDEWSPAEEDFMLLRATVAWSFDGEVTEESIGERTDRDTKLVIARLKALHMPVAETAEGK